MMNKPNDLKKSTNNAECSLHLYVWNLHMILLIMAYWQDIDQQPQQQVGP